MAEQKQIDDGGPAYPHAPIRDSEGGVDSYWTQHPQPGLSLRDFFAAHALAGMLAYEALDERDLHEYAREAYQQADAMLAQRKESVNDAV